MSTWRVYFSRLRAILVGALSEVFLSLVADIYQKTHVPSKLHTENFFHRLFSLPFNQPSGHALDRLVTVSSMHYCTSTPALSTSSSSRGLTSLRYGRTHLEGGFTLRCLQRLSLLNLACILYTSPSPRDRQNFRMTSSAGKQPHISHKNLGRNKE